MKCAREVLVPHLYSTFQNGRVELCPESRQTVATTTHWQNGTGGLEDIPFHPRIVVINETPDSGSRCIHGHSATPTSADSAECGRFRPQGWPIILNVLRPLQK